MRTSLYQLDAEYFQLQELMANPEIDEQFLLDALVAKEGEITVKIEKYGCFIENLKHTVEGRKKLVKSWQENIAVVERRIKRLEETVLNSMEGHGITEVTHTDTDTGEILFSMTSKENPPSVVIDNLDDIEDAFVLPPKPVERVPDKKKIAAAIKSGVGVLGAHLERKMRLVIK